MQIDWNRVLPVLVSIGIILLVAVLRNYSRTLAAITATMPINIPLALWIATSGDSDAQTIVSLTDAMLLGTIGTLVFMAVVWYTARLGWGVWAMIGAGYVGWAAVLLIVALVRR